MGRKRGSTRLLLIHNSSSSRSSRSQRKNKQTLLMVKATAALVAFAYVAARAEGRGLDPPQATGTRRSGKPVEFVELQWKGPDSPSNSNNNEKDGHHQQQQQQQDDATRVVDPEAALRWGYHILRERGRENALAHFDTLSSGSDFPTGETLFQLGVAHDEGREDLGIKRDEVAARAMYEHAAKRGHPASQHALAALLASSADAGGEVEAILYDFFASLGGDPLAHAALGYRYLHGLGTIQNCAQSLKHYQIAAKETIADLYSEGRGGIPRPVDRTRLSERLVAGRRPLSDSDAEMARLWEAAADAGDVGSIRTMAILHQHGTRGVDQDLVKAYRLFNIGVDANDHHSKSLAGNLLMRGAGVAADYKAARTLFESTKQNVVGLNGLGYLYYHGLGVKQDVIRAYGYFEKARTSDPDHPNADVFFNLGMVYRGGYLVDKRGIATTVSGTTEEGKVTSLTPDADKALSYFKQAAALGHVEASFQAALYYAAMEPLTIDKCQYAVSYIKKVVDRGPWMEAMQAALHKATAGDYGGALVLYSRLAEIGYEVAQSNAAWLLEAGHCGGASTNATTCEKRALRLYEHAARQGRASAEVKVGNFHFYGKAGLPVDYERAARRYLKAADVKHAEASWSMGYMHQIGRGVPQDLFLAKRYFDDAALASPDAVPVVRLSLLLLRLQPTWMRLREWWRGVHAMGEAWLDSESADDWKNALPATETLSLVSLVGLLAVVMAVRQRQRRRRREGGDAEA